MQNKFSVLYVVSVLNNPFNLELLRQASEVAQLHFQPEMTSTSDVCKLLLVETDQQPQFPLLVLTQQQTAGRGQLNRSWWSTSGALTFTWARQCDSRSATGGIVSLAAALSVAEAIESTIGSLKASIKWPNDVFVAGNKVAGILIETLTPKNELGENQITQLIGIGINTNNSMVSAPEEISKTSTSLCDITNVEIDLQELLSKTLTRLQLNLAPADADTSKKRLDQCIFRSVCQPNSQVDVETPQGPINGLFRGFNESGHLLVECDGMVEVIASGRLRSW